MATKLFTVCKDKTPIGTGYFLDNGLRTDEEDGTIYTHIHNEKLDYSEFRTIIISDLLPGVGEISDPTQPGQNKIIMTNTPLAWRISELRFSKQKSVNSEKAHTTPLISPNSQGSAKADTTAPGITINSPATPGTSTNSNVEKAADKSKPNETAYSVSLAMDHIHERFSSTTDAEAQERHISFLKSFGEVFRLSKIDNFPQVYDLITSLIPKKVDTKKPKNKSGDAFLESFAYFLMKLYLTNANFEFSFLDAAANKRFFNINKKVLNTKSCSFEELVEGLKNENAGEASTNFEQILFRMKPEERNNLINTASKKHLSFQKVKCAALDGETKWFWDKYDNVIPKLTQYFIDNALTFKIENVENFSSLSLFIKLF